MDNILLLSTSEVNTWDGVEGSALAPIFSSKIGQVENSSDNCEFWTIFSKATLFLGFPTKKSVPLLSTFQPEGTSTDRMGTSVAARAEIRESNGARIPPLGSKLKPKMASTI